MRKKVYEYISAHPNATHHTCASALDITELEALKWINKLSKEGLLNLHVLPLGNTKDPNCSCFYTVNKPYHD